MRKFMSRPPLALAAALSLVFVIILIRTYVRVLDNLTAPIFDDDDIEISLESVGQSFSSNKLTESEVIGPQLPRISSLPSFSTEVTLGTFAALTGTCFLREGLDYATLYSEFDDFNDLHRAVKTDESPNEEHTTADTLGQLLHIKLCLLKISIRSFRDTDTSASHVENSLIRFHSEISRYNMYSKNSATVDDLMYDMRTQGISKIDEQNSGTQFKLLVKFDNGVQAMFKPLRVSREEQAQPNSFYFAEYERHTSEIAAFHLDRVLGFNRAMPVVGRSLNMIVEMMRIAEPKFQRNFFVSPKPDENICFTGSYCGQMCDAYHPICGNGTLLEGSFMALFPDMEVAVRSSRSHPWAIAHKQNDLPQWESDFDYCEKVKADVPYSNGRILLELIDLSIFDFLIQNMDRQDFQRFDIYGRDTFALRFDHGRAFGKAFHDELRILAPMLQCCMIRSSTLKTLLEIHTSEKPLSVRMKESMADDELSPILWDAHLIALDRRLTIVLQAIRDCITRSSADDVIFTKDNSRYV